MVLLALGLAWIVRMVCDRDRRWLWLPATLVALFSLGELHRATLRHAYRVDDVAEATVSAWALEWPLTTTHLQVTRHVLEIPESSARLRVVQLTDMHFTPALAWDYYRSIVERSNAEEPDIIVMTGDYVSKSENLPLLTRWLELPLRAKYGVYAVLGNHDFWAGVSDVVRQQLERANVHVLSGTCARLEQGAPGDWWICGTEWPWGPDFEDPALRASDRVLVLSHTPDNIYALRGRASVVFSGHNHGGQWRIPGVGALVVPSRYGRRFDRGHFSVDGTELFVSAGLGADFPPIRLYCRPELTVVDFEPANESSHRRLATKVGEERSHLEWSAHDSMR